MKTKIKTIENIVCDNCGRETVTDETGTQVCNNCGLEYGDESNPTRPPEQGEHSRITMERDEARAQRDELLAAAKNVINDTTTTIEPFPHAVVRRSIITKLQAAIAKCEAQP